MTAGGGNAAAAQGFAGYIHIAGCISGYGQYLVFLVAAIVSGPLAHTGSIEFYQHAIAAAAAGAGTTAGYLVRTGGSNHAGTIALCPAGRVHGVFARHCYSMQLIAAGTSIIGTPTAGILAKAPYRVYQKASDKHYSNHGQIFGFKVGIYRGLATPAIG